MQERLKVAIIGLGPLGQNLTKAILNDSRFELISLVDKDPKKINTKFENLTIKEELEEKPGLVFLTTSSRLEQIEETIFQMIERGISLVSSCEELIYPWKSFPELASKIEIAAKTKEVKILGTGINPGFLMDSFLIKIFQSQIISEINSVYYERIIDTNKRRIPFQNKVGVGMSPEEFEQAKAENKIGHVGFRESVHMLCYFLNWQLESLEESIEPIVESGKVIGINQKALGKCANNKFIEFIFKPSSKNNDRDIIKINSAQSLDLEFKTGVNGEAGTVAMLINSAFKLMKLESGLKTMLDL